MDKVLWSSASFCDDPQSRAMFAGCDGDCGPGGADGSCDGDCDG